MLQVFISCLVSSNPTRNQIKSRKFILRFLPLNILMAPWMSFVQAAFHFTYMFCIVKRPKQLWLLDSNFKSIHTSKVSLLTSSSTSNKMPQYFLKVGKWRMCKASKSEINASIDICISQRRSHQPISTYILYTSVS